MYARLCGKRPTDVRGFRCFRSSKQIYAQVIDDATGHTLAAASTIDKELKGKLKGAEPRRRPKSASCWRYGQAAGIEKVVFDRGGYMFHGRVKALADAAREAGLSF